MLPRTLILLLLAFTPCLPFLSRLISSSGIQPPHPRNRANHHKPGAIRRAAPNRSHPGSMVARQDLGGRGADTLSMLGGHRWQLEGPSGCPPIPRRYRFPFSNGAGRRVGFRILDNATVSNANCPKIGKSVGTTASLQNIGPMLPTRQTNGNRSAEPGRGQS